MNEKIGEEMRTRVSRPAVQTSVQTVVRTPKWVFLLLGLLVILLVVASYFAWNFYAQTKKPGIVPRVDDKSAIIQNIASHVVLPSSEEPVFATVTDPAKLADQPFFVNAETGDKVLVYPRAKKAILYRPSTDRIIEMMPIDLGATAF